MKKIIFLAAMIAATPAFANELSQGKTLGTSVHEIKSTLTGMGYDVRKSQREKGKIEVYVVKNNMRQEIYVDPQTGKVTMVKTK